MMSPLKMRLICYLTHWSRKIRITLLCGQYKKYKLAAGKTAKEYPDQLRSEAGAL